MKNKLKKTPLKHIKLMLKESRERFFETANIDFKSNP